MSWARDRVLLPKLLQLQGVRLGEGLQLVGRPWIVRHPQATIEIGSNVVLFSGSRSNPFYLPRPCSIYALRENARIRIGDDTGMSGTAIISEVSIEIGKRVQIGPEVIIIDSDFHPADPVLRARRCREGVVRRPVRIGDDVFIGARAIIMKGVTIGNGSVVAAGAVVFQSVKPGEVVIGNPAKVVGSVGS